MVAAGWVGPDAVIVEEVQELLAHQQGTSWQAWVALWNLAGYQVLQRPFEAAACLPAHRSRVLAWAVRQPVWNMVGHALTRLADGPQLLVPQGCPYARGVVTPHISTEQLLSAEDLAVHLDPKLQPWAGYRWYCRPGCRAAPLMAAYRQALQLPQALLAAKGL